MKRGFTILELLISIALISIVLLLLLRVMMSLEVINHDTSYASDDEIGRTEIIKNIEENFLEYHLNGMNIQKKEEKTVITFQMDEVKVLEIASKQLTFDGVLKGLDERTIEKDIDKWLEKFSISSYKNRKIKELSKGNQQKIQFISAIINHPKLLILDEPFTGLDPINVKMMKDAIYDLQKEGTSIIFSSHQMEYIEDFCEKLVILVKGHPVVSGMLKDIKEDFGIKNIMLRGDDLPLDKIKKVKGVLGVSKVRGEIEVKIEDKTVAPKIFSLVKNSDITKYDVVEPTLNEIFIAKVGGIHE